MRCPLCKNEATQSQDLKNRRSTIDCQFCGQYLVSDFFLTTSSSQGARPLLSGMARRASDLNQPITITEENEEELERLAPKNFKEKTRLM
jgi:hypothetical protein